MNSKWVKKFVTGAIVLLITTCFIPAMAGAVLPGSGWLSMGLGGDTSSHFIPVMAGAVTPGNGWLSMGFSGWSGKGLGGNASSQKTGRRHQSLGDDTSDAQESTGTPVINEIVAKDADGGDDWIELYAVGGSVYLGDYSVTDDSEDRKKAALPDVTLAADEFIIIRATDEAPEDGAYYVPFKLGSDDAVILYKGDDVVDMLDWADGDASSGYSYGRLPDGTGEAMILEPTAGTANQAASTTSDTEVSRPEGWEEESHGNNASPNYDVVFQDDVVQRLDITIASSDWQAMLEDMTTLYGEFGQGVSQGLGGEMPGNMIPLDGQGPGGEMPNDRVSPDGQIPDNNMGDGPVDGMLDGEDDTNPIWVPCNLMFQGKQWYYTGIRFKGNSSLSSAWRSGNYKMPFRFDFDEFEDEYPEIDNQRFYGFKKLSLSSGFSDNSLIREKVTADIFREAGVPSARTAFYRLYIDYGEGSKYFGLYTMVEIPADPMLESQFSASGGNLYKPDGTGASFASFDEASFDKETNEDEADYSDVIALYEALHADRTDSAAWRTTLESVLNVDGFIKWLAVNTLIQNWDTYGNMTHNYYLYNEPEDGRLNWIPWDNNMALSDQIGNMAPLSLELSEVNDNWPLIRFLMDDPVYWNLYTDYIETIVNDVFYPERMISIYEAAHNLIRPYVIGEEGEVEGYTQLRSPEAFDEELEYLKTHVQIRYEDAFELLTEN